MSNKVMQGKINIQTIPEERLKKGYPAYFYDEGYLFDSIEEILIGKSGAGYPDDITLSFENGKYKFSANEAYELFLTHKDKIYVLDPSQWNECLDNDWHSREIELKFQINKNDFAEIIVEPIKIGKTQRGFSLGEFKDDYGHSCTIQMSSVATRRCIWLGIDNADPKIMASQAPNFGVKTNQTTGWVKYPVPDEVLMNTRMHLTREDVKRLLPLLTHFANHGDLNLES